VLRAAARDPSSASEAVFLEALGEEVWRSLPAELREMFADASPAVLAEIRGRGLDLSDAPASFSARDLAAVTQPTLIVSAEDSPEALRLVCDRLAEGLPDARFVRVTGGHLINPAHREVLGFIEALPRG
jgi:pimeloyl-ACP methyl ester carboxylesterase